MSRYPIDSYSISEGPIPPVCKSPAIWVTSGNTTFPVAYLRKPKHISQKSFVEIVRSIEMHLPAGWEIEFEEE